MNLREWLRNNNVTTRSLAKKLLVHEYYLGEISRGVIRPSKRLARDITEITNGEVTFIDLVNIDQNKLNDIS